jgi:hypothetical protein
LFARKKYFSRERKKSFSRGKFTLFDRRGIHFFFVQTKKKQNQRSKLPPAPKIARNNSFELKLLNALRLNGINFFTFKYRYFLHAFSIRAGKNTEKSVEFREKRENVVYVPIRKAPD